jgi:catechol 2,3-dioxygenase-like lactoylglutathione lyase family enzyme
MSLPGDEMSKPAPARSRFSLFATATFASAPLALLFAALLPSSGAAAQGFFGASKGQVVGMEFDGRSVSNLDKSVAFYKMLGFTEVPNLDKSWRKDEVMDRIHGTRGVESRMAKLTINTNLGQQTPFTLYLREFRGIKRRNVMGGKTAWEPGATHIEVVVPDSQKLWSDLKAANMLWPRTWGGELIPLPGQTKGTVAYMTDPDGMDVEIVEASPAVPEKVDRPGRPGNPPGFNHVGLVTLDGDKARAFYGVLMGEQFPATPSQWTGGDFMDSAVGGHGNILRIFNGTFALALDHDARMRFELVEYENRKKPVEPYAITDIGVNYVGLEVTDIDDLLARLKGAGVTVVSDGIVEMKGGYRVALVRDFDTGAFVELYEPPKK